MSSAAKAQNWSAIRIGSNSNTLVAVAANQMVAGAWVIDSAGGTWFVNESGSTAHQIARPEFLQPTSHQIGLFGSLNNAMAATWTRATITKS